MQKSTYNVLSQSQVRPFLMEWVKREWEIDNSEFPDQPWSLEWLDILQRADFSLETLQLKEIRLRKELMDFKSGTYSFTEELRKRAGERKESLLRGISLEPLIVNGDNMELMDGYTRYMVLRKHKQERVYAYVSHAPLNS
jgi:hypothetical protein